MSMSTAPAYESDRLIRWAARAATRAAPGPHKQYARAAGISRSRATRHLNGDAYAPASRFFELLDGLARNPKTTPFPLITEAILVTKRADFEGVDDEVLRSRLNELAMQEHEREAAQNRAIQVALLSRDYTELANPLLSHADALVEMAAIAEELEARREP